jgi:heterodisulfide reductase subunit A-like polyferredoxin
VVQRETIGAVLIVGTGVDHMWTATDLADTETKVGSIEQSPVANNGQSGHLVVAVKQTPRRVDTHDCTSHTKCADIYFIEQPNSSHILDTGGIRTPSLARATNACFEGGNL